MPVGTYEGTIKPGEKKLLMPERAGRTSLTLQVEGGSLMVSVGGEVKNVGGLNLGPGAAHNAVWLASNGDNFVKSYTATEEW